MASLARLLEVIMTPSAPVFIVGALIVVLFPVLLHLFLVRATPYTTLPSVLLVGPPGSGKTSLLTLLERGDAPAATHTSQAPQSVEFTASSEAGVSFRDKDNTAGAHTKFLVVDTPGHGKLRHHAYARLAPGADAKVRAVVFVVDAAQLGEPDALAPTAEYLYDLLLALQRRASAAKSSSSSAKAGGAIPLLVAANKTELFTALPPALVRTVLEDELTRIRASRSKGLLDSGVGAEDIGSEEHDGWLGEYGSEKFAFAQLGEFDIDVDVLGGSVTGGDGAPSVDAWWEWITSKI